MTHQATIHDSIRALIEVYLRELADLRFGDVDATSLQQAAAKVEEKMTQVQAAETALADARSEFSLAEKTLYSTAQRAHGYARVYADDRPELRSQLDAIVLPGKQRELSVDTEASTGRRGRAGRPRKEPDPSQRPLVEPIAVADIMETPASDETDTRVA